MAETSRRLGVTTAAPYGHFARRDEMLALVVTRALEVFAAMVAAEIGCAPHPGNGWRLLIDRGYGEGARRSFRSIRDLLVVPGRQAGQGTTRALATERPPRGTSRS